MLVLSRKLDEKIVIGPDAGIVITVVGIRNGQVRLGIQAPAAVPVHRSEVWEEIQATRPASPQSGQRPDPGAAKSA